MNTGYFGIPKTLGINPAGVSPSTMETVRNSMRDIMDVNREHISALEKTARRASAGNIQRRGTIQPGDSSNLFGLHNQFNQITGFGFNPFSPFGTQRRGGFSPLGFGPSSFGGFGTFGLGGNFGSLTGFSRGTMMAHYKMSMAVQAYKGFGIIRNVVDLMANFAAEGLKIKHKSKNIEKFYQRWAEHVGLQERVAHILRSYYKTSNVHIYTTMGQIDEGTYDRMKRAKASQVGPIDGFGVANNNDPDKVRRIEDVRQERKKKAPLREIPWRYTILNPFQMDLRGDKFFGGAKWVFILDEMTRDRIKKGPVKDDGIVDFLEESEVNLPREFKELIDDKDNRVVNLDPAKLWTIHYMKDDHEDWADPMVWPIMADLFFKTKMRSMDISVCDSVINAITIFKLGDWKNGFVPPKEHFREFSEMLRSPTAAMNMVWNDAISMESNYPPVEKILSIQKYESVDRDILRGLGVPDTLVGGATNSNFSTGFLGVRTLLERLEEGRNAVLSWLNSQLRMIAAIMGHRDIPTVRFGKMSLRDEKAEKMLMIQLLDRNIISIEAVLETFGEDFAIELERLKDEEKIRESTGVFQKHSPYVDPINDLDAEEQMEKESRLRRQEQRLMKKMVQKERRNNRDQNGRPPNSEGIPQENERETKPKGMASFISYEREKTSALVKLEKVFSVLTNKILKARGKTYKKELLKSDCQAIEDISFVVASHCGDEINNSIINFILSKTPTLNKDTLNTYNSLVDSKSTLSDRKDAMATAIALYNMEEVNA